MKVVFVYWAYPDQGSECDLEAYVRAGRKLGHDVLVYGPPDESIALDFSKNLESADGLVFVFEWTQALQKGNAVDWARLLATVPRRRRVVIDCDGMYNDPLQIDGDLNHRDPASSRRWLEICDSLSDKICQPTYRPARANVRPFLFHVYNPDWETPVGFAAKPYSMIYVGHSKFRWRPMARVLHAVEPVRAKLGRIGLVGHGWAELPRWAASMGIQDHYYTEPDYLQKLHIEVLPPIPFKQVIATMSQAVFNPVVYRPLFERLDLVTCRTFETVAAGTIPLFALNEAYVREIYGDAAAELVLDGERAPERILDILHRPQHYAEIVAGIRARFRQEHTPEARLRELVKIIES